MIHFLIPALKRPPKNLKLLFKRGFKCVGMYADKYILAFEQHRILYDLKTDLILFEYDTNF